MAKPTLLNKSKTCGQDQYMHSLFPILTLILNMALQMKLESAFFVRRKNEKEYTFMMPGETKNLFRGDGET